MIQMIATTQKIDIRKNTEDICLNLQHGVNYGLM